MTTVLFDLETNGLMPEVDTVHCAVAIVDGELLAFHERPDFEPHDGSLEDFRKILDSATLVVGHNVQGYDLPVWRHVMGKIQGRPEVFDTLIAARFLWPDASVLEDMDLPSVPKKVRHPHSLEAWGWRLGDFKGDFKGPWDEFTQDMLTYCVQDVRLTQRLYEFLDERVENAARPALAAEHRFAAVCESATQHGFRFDEELAEKLEAKLQADRAELLDQIHDHFPPREVVRYTPKKRLRREEIEEFNPNSRQQLAKRLRELGWTPLEETPTGQDKVDDASLARYSHLPQVAALRSYLTVQKRLSQLSEGKGAIRRAAKNGRVHCRILHNGTITHRCSHSRPNLGQVPSAGHEYGAEFRELFRADDGWELTGTDASGLELRMLAHYLNDEGFTESVVHGQKEDGTDAHSRNMKAAGLDSRDLAKTALYAVMYGAGDFKLGKTVDGGIDEGRQLRKAIVSAIPGFQDFLNRIAAALVKRGMGEWRRGRRGRFLVLRPGAWLYGLDRRPVYLRSAHAILNTLLQSAGALVVKHATIRTIDNLVDFEIMPGVHFHLVAHVHDEWQITHRPGLGDSIGRAGQQAIEAVADDLNVRCPLEVDYSTGASWKDTH